jgi:hypothetical protein
MTSLTDPIRNCNIDVVRFARRHRLPLALAALIAELAGLGVRQ